MGWANSTEVEATMMRLVPSQEELPSGSHSLSFYASPPEAARNMASFVRGARSRGQKALVLTDNDRMAELYRREISKEVPELSDAVRRISGPHARPSDQGLKLVEDATEFAAAHPEGATMCGDTIPSFLDRRTLPNILVYEDWFDSLRPFYHRGLCPYDLAHLPVDQVPRTFARLAHAHTHAVLSSDPNPGVRFLQLLILPYVENPPKENLGWLAQAVEYGLVDQERDAEAVDLTPRGENFARALMAMPDLANRADVAARNHRRGLPERAEGRSPRLFKPD